MAINFLEICLQTKPVAGVTVLTANYFKLQIFGLKVELRPFLYSKATSYNKLS